MAVHLRAEAGMRMNKIRTSLKNINLKLYLALIVLGLGPTIYTTVRVFFLGQLPGEWSFSIAGQLSWVNLLYEVMSEAIILPLFFFIGKVKEDKKAFANCVRTGMIVSLGVYAVLSVVIFIFAEQLLALMAADESIIAASATYIRIESVANVFSILAQFALVALVSVNRSRYIYVLTGARLVLSVLLDTFLVSALPVSLNLGVNGIGYSNIAVNALLLAVTLVLLHREGITYLRTRTARFRLAKGLFEGRRDLRARVARAERGIYADGRAHGQCRRRAGYVLGRQ